MATLTGFAAQVSGEPGACWPWSGGRTSRGYGGVYVDGQTWSTHRLAYELVHGPIPEGAQVCHTCDNPPCCNPAHLFLGDHLANARDREAKGRGVAQHRIGEANPFHKLTAGQVTEIRRRAMAGESQRALGREFAVSHETVGRVVRGQTWKEGVALSPR